MSVELDILDEKTKSLDEVIEFVEAVDESGGPTAAVARDEELSSQLFIAVECMKVLGDLHSTISSEGVSTYDVQVLRGVQAKMSGISIGGAFTVALERFDNMFTTSRSDLNLKVSVEAVKFEFGRILKEWFYKLIDFVVDVVRWVKGVMNSETVIRHRTEDLNNNIMKAKQHLINMRNLNSINERKFKPAYDAIQEVVLADPKLPKCRLTLMGFGDQATTAEFDKHLRLLLSFSKNFSSTTSNLINVLEGGDFAQANATFVGRVIEDATKEILEFAVESTDEDYFKASMPGLDMYQPKYVVSRKAYYIEPFNNILKLAVNDLRRIKRFDKLTEEADIERVREAVVDLTTGIKSIEKVIETIVKLNQCYFKVSASYINYYSRCFTYTREDFTKNIIDDLGAAALNKIDKGWDSFLDSIGFV